MELPGRTFSANNKKSKYGFNGQERSTEINDNSYTAEFWQYDSRIVRRFNVDPVQKEWESSYACFAGNPILNADPLGNVYVPKNGGKESANPGKTHIVIYTKDDIKFVGAALTHMRSIIASSYFDKSKDIVIPVYLSDLGKLEDYSEKLVQFNKLTNRKTSSVTFFTHGGSDGPVGEVAASKNSLEDQTQKEVDANQITAEGWSKINFDFSNDNNTLVNFYGCNMDGFAGRFMDLQPDVKYVSATSGSSAVSYSYEKFNKPWFPDAFDDLYMIQFDDDEQSNKPLPLVIYDRKLGKDPVSSTRNTKENSTVVTGLYPDNSGSLRGKGKDSSTGKSGDTIAH
jgi:RHS repeat-associated protein